MAWHSTWNDPENQGRYRHVRVQFGGPARLTNCPGTMWLLIITIAAYVVLQMALGDGAMNVGALSAESLFSRGQVWRLLTYQFLHDPDRLGHILLNMFIFWMVGRMLERQIGTRRFVLLYLACGIVGGLGQTLLNVALATRGGAFEAFYQQQTVGASAGVYGMLIAYAMLSPNAVVLLMFILPLRIKWLALGIVVLTTLYALQSLVGGPQDNIAHAAHLGGMLCAAVWIMATGRARFAFAMRVHHFWLRLKATFRPRPRPSVRHHPVVGGGSNRPEPPPAGADERQLDEILRKVHDHGIASLSDRERDFLRRMSERKRDDIDFDNRFRR